VTPGEPAALAGLMREDVIEKVRDKPTVTADAFNKVPSLCFLHICWYSLPS
jgi:S1-C subfamily serine protease